MYFDLNDIKQGLSQAFNNDVLITDMASPSPLTIYSWFVPSITFILIYLIDKYLLVESKVLVLWTEKVLVEFLGSQKQIMAQTFAGNEFAQYCGQQGSSGYYSGFNNNVMSSNENNCQFANYQPHMSQFPQPYPQYYNYGYFPPPGYYAYSVKSSSPHSEASQTGSPKVNLCENGASGTEVSSMFICLFGVLRRFQHCTGHITTGSWKGRGNQYIEFARVVYCKLPTNGKQLPAFPLTAMTGIEPRPQRWEARVLPLCHRGPLGLFYGHIQV